MSVCVQAPGCHMRDTKVLVARDGSHGRRGDFSTSTVSVALECIWVHKVATHCRMSTVGRVRGCTCPHSCLSIKALGFRESLGVWSHDVDNLGDWLGSSARHHLCQRGRLSHTHTHSHTLKHRETCSVAICQRAEAVSA